jgi:hypothetical protein
MAGQSAATDEMLRRVPQMTDVLERVKTYQQFIGGEWVDSAIEDYTVVKHVMLKI